MESCITQFILSVNTNAAVFCCTVLNTSWQGFQSLKKSINEVKYSHINIYVYVFIYMCVCDFTYSVIYIIYSVLYRFLYIVVYLLWGFKIFI